MNPNKNKSLESIYMTIDVCASGMFLKSACIEFELRKTFFRSKCGRDRKGNGHRSNKRNSIHKSNKPRARRIDYTRTEPESRTTSVRKSAIIRFTEYIMLTVG